MHEGDGFSAKTLLSDRAMVRPASSVKCKTPLDFFLTLDGPSPLGYIFVVPWLGPSQLKSMKARYVYYDVLCMLCLS